MSDELEVARQRITAYAASGHPVMPSALWLLREVERLTAEVERLPRTKDGVPVTPGMILFAAWKRSCGCYAVRELQPVDAVERVFVRRYGGDGYCTDARDLFSSRAAADEWIKADKENQKP